MVAVYSCGRARSIRGRGRKEEMVHFCAREISALAPDAELLSLKAAKTMRAIPRESCGSEGRLGGNEICRGKQNISEIYNEISIKIQTRHRRDSRINVAFVFFFFFIFFLRVHVIPLLRDDICGNANASPVTLFHESMPIAFFYKRTSLSLSSNFSRIFIISRLL